MTPSGATASSSVSIRFLRGSRSGTHYDVLAAYPGTEASGATHLYHQPGVLERSGHVFWEICDDFPLFRLWRRPIRSEIVNRLDTGLELLWLSIDQMNGAAQA